MAAQHRQSFQRVSTMFVTVLTYRARIGEEDAVIALHEDWQLHHRANATGFVSGELLQSLHDGRTFTDIARYESKESAGLNTRDPEQAAWQRRLLSLTESEPVTSEYRTEWWV